MRTIDITEILSPDLKSRMRAQDLKLFVENCKEDVVLDFCNVKFATRIFIDEFYNLFMKNPSANTFKVEITNVPEDINTMLETVSRTQTRVKIIFSHTREMSFENVDDLVNYLSTATL